VAALAGGLAGWPDDDGPLGSAGWRRVPPSDDVEPSASEVITLIEFVWAGSAGEQPVILVSREWLQ
jgi:hypothetical protein